MPDEADETLIRQILFRHRTQVKGGTPNTPGEVEAIRFGYYERKRILAEREANLLVSPKKRGRRDHRPTSDGLPREDER